MAITQKVFSSRVNNLDSSIYVGETGRLFYEQPAIVGVAPVLKYSDGSTPGGLPLSGSSLTFSGSTPPDNPHDGLLWWDSIDGRLYIYYNNTWVDASPDVQGAVTNIVAGSGISIDTSTGVVTITATVGPDDDTSYITTSSVNTLIANSLTNYATQTYVNSQGFITSSALSPYTPNYVTVSSAGTYTASTLTSINILLYTAGSVNVTWTMPPNPIDGQVCKWTNASTQTSVFFISPGVTLIPAISGPYNAGTKFQYVYRSADNEWYACP